jgi:hypothetical protein
MRDGNETKYPKEVSNEGRVRKSRLTARHKKEYVEKNKNKKDVKKDTVKKEEKKKRRVRTT